MATLKELRAQLAELKESIEKINTSTTGPKLFCQIDIEDPGDSLAKHEAYGEVRKAIVTQLVEAAENSNHTAVADILKEQLSFKATPSSVAHDRLLEALTKFEIKKDQETTMPARLA